MQSITALDETSAGTISKAAITHIPSYRSARIGAAILFLVDGAAFGTWAALIPSFQAKFALSHGALSGVLLALTIGALISMPCAGQAIARWGSRGVAALAALLVCVALAMLSWASGLASLVAAAIFFGAVKGALDVAANAQAVLVQAAGHRPIMSSLHALWSVGGLAAAAVAGFALARGFQPAVLMTSVAAVLALLTCSAHGRLLTEPRRETASAPPRRLPSAPILKLGALAFLALFAEGALMDWSAVYARSVIEASESMAPLAYGVYCFAMAGGRLLGDLAIQRWGSVAVLRLSGFLAAAGLATVVLLPFWPAAMLGFLISGLGLSNLVPIFMSAAGNSGGGQAGPGLAAVSTVGYFGFLAGPPVIGCLSTLAGLRIALSPVMLFGLVIALAGGVALRQSRQTPVPPC